MQDEHKFRSLSGWVILLVLGLVLCLTGCEPGQIIQDKPSSPDQSQLVATSERPDPWDSLLRVVDYLQQDDSKALLEDIYPRSLERYGREQIVDRNAKIHQDLGVKQIIYSNLAPLRTSENGSQVFYTAKVHYQCDYGDIDGETILSLIWHPEAAAWQLEWTPALILPGLSDQGQVVIEDLPAQRGTIYDRAGWPLALETSVVEVSLVPRTFDGDRIPEVNALLGLTEGTIEAKLAQSWVTDTSLVPIAMLSDLHGTDFKQFKDLNLSWQEKTSRYYPWGEALAPLVGYVSRPTAEDLSQPEYHHLQPDTWIGRTGLEAIYDQTLRGQDGFRVYISGSYEKSLITQAAKPGEDLHLTIDAPAQRAIYFCLRGADAAVTGVDPQTGDILCLVSSPAYDPNAFVSGMDGATYQALLHAPDRPLIAKFQPALTPGSTQKLVTAMVALNEQVITPQDEMFIEGKTWQPDAAWGNYEVTRYRELNQSFTLADALVFSDNIFFARLAYQMGADTFMLGLSPFHLGEEVCPDYPFARSQMTNPGSNLVDNSILLADTSYGQGEILYPQVQLANIYAALLNGGYYQPLRLIYGQPSASVDRHRILEEQYIPYLQTALERVVDEQFLQSMSRPHVALAGKSGTAEMGDDRLTTWFIGYERHDPGLVLALSLFHAEQDDDRFAVQNYFADIMAQLYAKTPYQPTPIEDRVRIGESLPPFEPYHDVDPDTEEMVSEPDDETSSEAESLHPEA